ncbi:SgcJ/EcaC family oxidoreductase [Nocardia barduliensis]|uniref:SgcJ/EcaC family oxidoreductase n=1 Tax=Nocardia barduliensis TaxID=2736643 RepID=UPI0015733B6B|nr:SgcJ/EcaC family oxidoreductase [Nocardia barduliensis]
MSTTASTPPLVRDTTVDHTDDIAAIRRIVANAEAGFNTNDAHLLSADFIANAAVVNAMGTLITGFDALLDANRSGLAGFLKDQYARYELADITFLRPDVAIGHKRAWATTAEGELLDHDHAMIALYVFVRQGDRWHIAARQNTLVPKAE